MSGETALRERAALLDELRQIVQSMKNLAFAELQRVSRMKEAQHLAQDTVAQALQSLPRPEPGQPTGGPALTCLLIGAERGFCGAFNTQLVQAAKAWLDEAPGLTMLLASHRLVEQWPADAARVRALPGCAASDEAEAMVDTWLSALGHAVTQGQAVWLMHVDAHGVARHRLWPWQDAADTAPAGTPPMHYLPPDTLRHAMGLQLLRLRVQGALYTSLEQENHWRLAQMQRAQDHLDELGQALRRRYATLRQANITNELETLATSGTGGANHPDS